MRFDAGIADHGQRIARGSAFRIVVDDDVDRRLRVGHSHAPALTLAPSLWPISLRLRRIAISSRLASGSARNRSDERRVGKECVSTGRSRWSPEHKKKNK